MNRPVQLLLKPTILVLIVTGVLIALTFNYPNSSWRINLGGWGNPYKKSEVSSGSPTVGSYKGFPFSNRLIYSKRNILTNDLEIQSNTILFWGILKNAIFWFMCTILSALIIYAVARTTK